MATPGLIRARASANSASALGSLRAINSAQISYAITCGVGFYAAGSRHAGNRAAGFDGRRSSRRIWARRTW